jgi:type VI secretion system Hcp family effector
MLVPLPWELERDVKRRVGETQTGQPATAPRAVPPGRLRSVVALQRMAGNRAVAGLMRDASATGGAVSAHPASKMRITIKGRVQGAFKGSARDGAIEAWSFHFGAVSPHDLASGESTGKRRYKAVTFKKALDAASPQLMDALANNEVLDQVRIEFISTQTNAAGVPAGPQETIVLKNASVASFDQDSDDSSDSVSLMFESFEMSNLPGKTSAADAWHDPAQ